MEMQQVQRRNIVVLGKTGAGKSTVANKIAGHNEFEVKKSTQSVTSKVSHTEAEVTDPKTNIKYNFKIIDTIGIFDTKYKNADVINEIKKYFQDKVSEGVNLVLFVFKQGRFTSEEQAAFNCIIKNFRDYITDISALVITYCENEDEDGRKETIEDFKKHTGNIAEFMKKGIHAVGFPDTSKMKEPLKKVYENDMKLK